MVNEKLQNLELSFIIPIWNSAPFIFEKYKMLTQIIKGVTESYEIIFCNDDSPDNSQEILDSIAQNDNRVRLLRNSTNRGLGYSVKRLIDESVGEIIAYTDIDLSFDVSKLAELMKIIKDYDVVVASRYSGIKSYIPLHRKVLSRCNWILCRMLFSIPIADIGTGFFLVKKKCFENINLTINGFTISTEIHVKLFKNGRKFAEVPVAYDHCSGPESTFKVIEHIIPTLFETLKLWYDMRKTQQ